MSKFLQRLMVLGAMILLPLAVTVQAQQVPNPGFEDWSGEKFNGEEQPKSWNASNVSQFGVNKNFAHKEGGHTGSYSMMVMDDQVGIEALGILETSPGYFSLGQPWSYIPSVTQVGKATAGTHGGINWTNRPDSMSVWIKRTGDNWQKEDFYLLYYAWSGTAKGNSFKNKDGGCTSVSYTNEESDIRLEMNGNECGTAQKATQVAEGCWRERATYGQWTNIRVPIYYMNNTAPTMMNIIFSASNYPNFRANSGLYPGNKLYVDDIEMIYASSIQKLYVGGKEWKGFDPTNTKGVQIYEVDENTTAVPAIKAYRGAGAITYASGKTVSFSGRELSGSEITIKNGDLSSTPTVITVKSDDGKSTTTYQIQFQQAASSNTKLSSLRYTYKDLDGKDVTADVPNFNPTRFNYSVELPYGTKAAPVVSAEGQDEGQQIQITQATSVTGSASIQVTAANGSAKSVYAVTFKVGQLSDNTLKDILVNGKSIPGFTPSQTVYKVSLPVGTTQMPTVKAVSAYADGEQTIVYKAPSEIDGGQYTISVTTPGNTVAKVYKLNFKLEASSYTYLADLQVVGNQVESVTPAQPNDPKAFLFVPTTLDYYVNLKMGTTALPEIKYTKGEESQVVEVTNDGLEGTTKITVTAGNGDKAVYKIKFKVLKSGNSQLAGIEIGGKALEGFDPNKTAYTVQLPIGTTTLPEIKAIPGDEFQRIVVTTAGVNGTTRITVTAGDESTTIYQITFSVDAYTNNTLKSLAVKGFDIGFAPETNEYWVNLPQGTTSLPEVTYELQDANFQTVSVRTPSGLTGDYKITVRPQSGPSRTYIIHFTVATSSNTALKMIYLDGVALADFSADKLEYEYRLPEGVSTIPKVTYEKEEDSQRVLSVLENKVQTITVTAQSGAKRVYSITFIVTVSQNAFLNMIYLDGKPIETPFDPNKLAYTDIPLEGATCPKITVDKNPGQQVTITAPFAAGTASIVVKPEEGASNTYTIEFVAIAAEGARLKGIKIDGKEMEEFKPTTMHYTRNWVGSLPTVEAIKNEGQKVQELWKGNVAWLHVTDAEGNKAAYSVTFHLTASGENALEGIFADGKLISGFNASQLTYVYHLTPGSTYPEISYQAASDAEVVFFGQLSDGVWGVTVVAANGAKVAYTVQYIIDPYDDATLKNLSVVGKSLQPAFAPNTLTYNVTLDEGETLPQVTVETRERQKALIETVNENEQQVIVVAESGATKTYRVVYTRKKSSNALLADILIDGVSLEGFEPSKADYEIMLEWRSKIVPNVFPIGQLPNQIITTAFSRPNGVTRIHVEAQDGTTADYSIAFPTHKSSNKLLDEIELISEYEDVELSFRPNKAEYTVTLPFEATICPQLLITKAEPEQRVDIISRPIGEKTEVIVYAENGESFTYSILFERELLKEKNLLSMIRIVELDQELSLKNKDQRDFNVTLPFGTRSLTVEYEKAYPGQTVFVQPGGVKEPTVITVKANNGNVADEVYRIIPTVPTEDPAVLTDITVNGVTIDGFNPEKFSYIVPVTDKPILRYTIKKGADINITYQSTKHWQAEVSCEEGASTRTNTYDVWFYYQNDVIPNGELNIDGTAKYNNAYKPAYWNTIADADDKYVFMGMTLETSGQECQKASDGSVYLLTKYRGNCARNIPGFMTLGTVAGEINTTNSFSYSGSVVFRNSPDTLRVRYKSPSLYQKNHIIYQLWGSEGFDEIDESDTEAFSNYKVRTINLSSTNNKVGDPTNMNIVLNSYKDTQGGLGTDGGLGIVAEMYVDWLRIFYNHTLTGLQVDAFTAAKDGNAFSVTLEDPERIEIPVLKFTGEVADQAQDVVWSAPEKGEDFSTRTATIRNWAENGADYTDYTLTVNRPLDTRNELKDLLLDGVQIANFAANKTSYELRRSPAIKRLPDIVPVPASSLQTVKTSFNQNTSTMTITVTPEKGKATVYTVKFITKWSDDTTLASITAGDQSLSPSQRNHTVTAEHMPVITFAKKSDLQVVSLINGVITVKAENGAEGKYTITRVNPKEDANAIITQFILDQPLNDFGGQKMNKEADKPAEAILFTRETPADSVVFVQTETQMEWRVYGSDDKQNTYVWKYPTNLSSNTDLANITVDGVDLENFNASLLDYVISTNEAIVLNFIPAEDGQTLQTVTRNIEGGVEYKTTVVSEDNHTKVYTVQVIRPKSVIGTLAGILLDGKMIDNFDPKTTDYNVVLPVGAYKAVQPKMPNLTYLAGALGQKITVEHGQVNGDPTVITVISELGTDTVYYVNVTAEPSHCSDLTGIMVNGVALDHFEPGRHFYSIALPKDEIGIDYTSNDRFQHVDTIIEVIRQGHEYHYTLHVMAEDGTSSDYLIEIYVENQLNDAQLANILLNGKALDDFERALNEELTFDGGNNNYEINLPSGTTILPEVSAQLKMDGQSVVIEHHGSDSILLIVTAMDGVTTNTYYLRFFVPLSKNADLSMIFLNGEPLEGFDPTYYFYQVTLPEGVHELPEVTGQQGEPSQTVSEAEIDWDKLQASIQVQAEDPETRPNKYIIVFHFTQSDADTLAMIYEDGARLEGFHPRTFFYNRSLPVGTTTFPDLSWEEINEWQTVTLDTVSKAADRLVRSISVKAESGKKNTYTVAYTIEKSNVDSLQMIFVQHKALPDFNASKYEYYYPLKLEEAKELTDNNDSILVEATPGDEYQFKPFIKHYPDTLIGKSLGYMTVVVATSQTGATRRYTIHYPVQLSDTALLNMIYLNGEKLENFDPWRFSYKLEIGMTDALPVVTVEKKEEAQTYDIQVNNNEVTILVTAEDGMTTQPYTLTFERLKSSETKLKEILLTDTQGTRLTSGEFPYRPDYYDYKVNLPFDGNRTPEEQLPTIDYIKYEPEQSVTIVNHNLPNGDIQADVTVTAPNGEDQAVYSIVFHFLRPSDAFLKTIVLGNDTVANFDPYTAEYTYSHPFGSTEDDYFAVNEVKWELSDPLATASATINSEGVITIAVIAQDGYENDYIIIQKIALDGDNTLKTIELDGVEIAGFDPEVTSYVYYLRDGFNPPSVTAEANSANADVSVGRAAAGETCEITCTAADKSERVYRILFAVSSIDDALVPTANDVIIRRVPGANQLFIATIRNGVEFALYDQAGRLVHYEKTVPPADPNDARVFGDLYNKDVLSDVVNYNSGLLIDILPGQVYIYGFYSMDKVFKSGKIRALPF